jgi:hypothetical protein
MNILYVKNENQVALFENEIKGQISDGMWENASPANHWKVWCNTTAKVESNLFGRRFRISKCNYNLQTLVDLLGKRMRLYVALSHITSNIELLEYLYDFVGEFRGIPPYQGEYWDKIRSQLAGYNPENINRLVISELAQYSTKSLRVDLKQLSDAMKTVITS